MKNACFTATCVSLLGSFVTVVLPAQGDVWVPLSPVHTSVSPQVRRSAAIAYDSVRDRVITVGGRLNLMGSAIYPQETWEFDGFDWHLIGAVGPIAFGGANDTTNVRAYYDAQRNVTVAIESKLAGPTVFHEWNGATWTPVLSVPQLTFPWRYGFDVAYDPVRGVAVLFGGYTGNQSLGDTWEYDGVTFQQVSSFGPLPRWGHAMTYDHARGRVVLHGGRNGPAFADMWDWNGTTWSPTPNAVGGPGARAFHGLGYDVARSRLVLLGNDSVGSDETWEWQPSGWTLAPATTEARRNLAVVYDSARERVLSFGGAGALLPTLSTSTFAYGEANDLAWIQSVGVGCPGPAGVPSLQATSSPRFGSVLTMNLSNLPTGPFHLGIGFIGFDDTQWGTVPLPASLDPLFPGCTAYLAAETTQWLGQSFSGSLPWNIPIPFLPAISGAPFFLQGGVLVAGYNPGGFVFSNALAGATGL